MQRVGEKENQTQIKTLEKEIMSLEEAKKSLVRQTKMIKI